MIVLALGLGLAWGATDPFPVARVRADAEPVHPLLDAWLREEGAVPRGRGGRRTQAGTASPGPSDTWITVHHVVAGARHVTLEIDGVDEPAEVVAVSTTHDLALLRATTPGPRVAGGTLDPTQPASSPGFPGDGALEVLSGPIRVAQVRVPLPGRPPEALWRMAAAVRRGQSGAPVLQSGVRVGVIVAGSEPDGPLAGDGLLLDERVVERISDTLLRRDPDRRFGVRLAVEDGAVVVTAVTPGSRADRAGLAPGDWLQTADGEPVERVATAAASIASGRVQWVLRRGDVLHEVRSILP